MMGLRKRKSEDVAVVDPEESAVVVVVEADREEDEVVAVEEEDQEVEDVAVKKEKAFFVLLSTLLQYNNKQNLDKYGSVTKCNLCNCSGHFYRLHRSTSSF